jgi:tetratricopeptide (TPR) repeat protein
VQESKSATIESVIRFADSLYTHGSYDNALLEYKRSYFFAGNELKSSLGSKIADCYLSKEDYTNARNYYDSAIVYSTLENSIIDFQFRKTLCSILEKNFGFALLETDKISADSNSISQKRKYFYKGICYFGMKQYDESYKQFNNSLAQNDTAKRAQLQQLFVNIPKLKRPNSTLAIILSIFFPGSGQIYSGDIGGGINSAILLSGIYFIGSSAPISCFVVMIPFLYRYYIGGILNAKKSAEKMRDEKQHIFYRNLMEVITK